jgi:hypothetical protein
VDRFTDNWDPVRFGRAVEAVSAAFGQERLRVEATRQADTFARIEVFDPGRGSEDEQTIRALLAKGAHDAFANGVRVGGLE